MELPKVVRIAGFKYSCKLVPNLGRDSRAMGQSCGNALKIEIDESLPKQNKETTLIHEILEQINYRYELGLEHNKITILEIALYQVIKDNPEIFAGMCKEVGKNS